MKNDPIVAEVRRIREEIFKSFDCDMNKYLDYLQAREKDNPERLVTLQEMRRRGKAGKKIAGARASRRN